MICESRRIRVLLGRDLTYRPRSRGYEKSPFKPPLARYPHLPAPQVRPPPIYGCTQVEQPV